MLKCPPCLARAILQDKLVHCEGTDATESALHTVGGVLAKQGGGVTKQAGGPVCKLSSLSSVTSFRRTHQHDSPG